MSRNVFLAAVVTSTRAPGAGLVEAIVRWRKNAHASRPSWGKVLLRWVLGGVIGAGFNFP